MHSVKTILGRSIGGDAANKCSLHKGTTLMQILPLCYLHLVAASRSYSCVQDGLNTVQLVLLVFFLPSTSANTPIALMVSSSAATCAGGDFSWRTNAITNAHTKRIGTHCNLHFVVVVLYRSIYTHAHPHCGISMYTCRHKHIILLTHALLISVYQPSHLQGLVVMSVDLEDIYNSMLVGKVPAVLAVKSYPLLKPLSVSITDLWARLKLIISGLDRHWCTIRLSDIYILFHTAIHWDICPSKNSTIHAPSCISIHSSTLNIPHTVTTPLLPTSTSPQHCHLQIHYCQYVYIAHH